MQISELGGRALKRIVELEQRVKELESALEEATVLANDMIEINESNYDHDDVCRLNSESIELYEVLQNAYDKLIAKAVQND